MHWFKRVRILLGSVAWALALTTAVSAQLALQPVLSGLTEPRFVTHAGDGSGRLFFVEKGGQIRVLAPGASAATLFLDLQGQVGAADEGGLLGLAFHPSYRDNRRFFVFYTRPADNALVIAEHQTTADPNVANANGRELLVIPHPTYDNHNGGMLAFGGDGYLYIGTGDGGGANDPDNNAQNIESLLGKLLRIDVDRSDRRRGTPYAAPSDNPYVHLPGRDEIYSIGWRNPWRFSFDRSTQQLWVGDVGQAKWEEIDTPIVNGGNYGWPAYEGTECISTSGCSFTAVPPTHQYDHSGGRCSITGGYVYRGAHGVLPSGTFVFGDYCSGEIFSWDGAQQRTLLSGAGNIVSFGEDEKGELYVVERGGSVTRLVSTTACSLSLLPESASFGATGGTGTLVVSVQPSCSWRLGSDATWVTPGQIVGTGDATVTYTVAPYSGRAKRRVATLSVSGKTATITQSK